MSLSSENMLKLMAFADGELEGSELAEAKKLLETDTDAVRFVDQIAGLGEIVARGHAVRSGKAIATFDVTDAVMSQVENAKADARAGAPKVVSLQEASREREKRAGKAKDKSQNGLKIAGGLAAVLALAASVFIFTQHRTDEVPMAKGPTATATPSAVVANASSGTGVDVSTVNSPGNSVSVFYLPTANELSTSVVVWVDESGQGEK